MGEHPGERRAEDIVGRAFGSYRSTARGGFLVPDPAAVFAAARRRGRQRWMMAGLAAAGVMAIVAAGVVLTDPRTRGPQRPASQATDTGPTGEPPATSTQVPPPSVARTAASQPPDPREVNLRNATIDLPPWPSKAMGGGCRGGTVRFRDGDATTGAGYLYRILPGNRAPLYGDLDGQPGEEILARIGCGPPQSELVAGIIAFWVTPGLGVKTMGYVYVGPHAYQGPADGTEIRDRVVTLFITDLDHPGLRQERQYRWGGQRFEQIRGPTAFPVPDPRTSLPTPTPTS